MLKGNTMYCGTTIHGGRALDGSAREALDALALWQYNDFNGKKVSKWLKKLLLKGAKVQVGREYSPVLHVTIPHQGDSKAAVDKELAMAQSIMAQGKKLKADETSVERRTLLPIAVGNERSRLVARLWWD